MSELAGSDDLRSVVRFPPGAELSWALVPFVVLMGAFAARPSPPHDYWWPLVQGRLIVLGGAVPEADTLLYSLPPGTSFVNVQWLSHTLLYLAHRWAGHAGVALLASVACILTWLLLLRLAVRRTGAVKLPAALATLSVLFASPMLVPRAQTLVLPLFVAALVVCAEVADGRRPVSHMLWLAPITALWANMHGSFPLAALAALAAFAQLWKTSRLENNGWKLGLCAAALAGASIASPHGLRNLHHVVAGASVGGVSEWQPPSITTPEGKVAIAALVIVAALAWKRRRHGTLFDWIMLSALTLFVASAWRAVIWWALLLPVVLAPLFPASGKPGERGFLHVFPAAILFGAAVFCFPGVGLKRLRLSTAIDVKRAGEGAGYLNEDNPVELVREAYASGARRVFHDQKLGALVQWEFAGVERATFVDQRMELIPKRVWDQYFTLSAGRGGVASLRDNQVDTVVAHVQEQRGLIDALHAAGYVTRGRQAQYEWIEMR